MEKYKVLKPFTVPCDGNDMAFAEGSAFTPSEDKYEGTPEMIAELVSGGFLELEVEATPEEYTGEMGKYKITGEAFYTDENGVRTGTLEVGSVQTLPKEVGDVFVEDGVAELVSEEEEKDEEVVPEEGTEDDVAEVEAAPAADAPLVYLGKQIVSVVPRELNDRTYQHVRLEDGSEYDLTDDDYQVMLAANGK